MGSEHGTNRMFPRGNDGGGETLWQTYGAGVVGLIDTTQNVVIGGTTTVDTEKFRVVGGSLVSDPAGLAAYTEWREGSNAALSPGGSARIRYKQTTNQLELSVNGGAYAVIAVGSTGYVQGGNAFGAPGILGLTDANDLFLVTIANQAIYLRPFTLGGSSSAVARRNGQSGVAELVTQKIFVQEGALQVTPTNVAAGGALTLNPTTHYEIRCYPTLGNPIAIALPAIQLGATDAQSGQRYLIGNFGGVAVAGGITITPNASDSIEYGAAGAAMIISTATGVIEIAADFSKASGGGGFNWKVVRLVP